MPYRSITPLLGGVVIAQGGDESCFRDDTWADRVLYPASLHHNRAKGYLGIEIRRCGTQMHLISRKKGRSKKG